MTIALQYLTDLSRVRISLSDLPDGMVQVQRSLNPNATDVIWERGIVRGGRALPVSGGVAVLDDYEFHADVENHYRVVPVEPAAGLVLPGESGSYAGTPDDSALGITGDIDVRVDLTTDWDPPTVAYIAAKYAATGNQRSWALQLTAGGVLVLWQSANGTNALTYPSSVGVPFEPGTRGAVRVTLDVDDGAGGRVATFYTAPTINGPWTQLGNPVVQSGTTSLFNSSASLTVSGRDEGTSQPLTGVVHALQVRDGIDGSVVANVDFGAQAHGETQFTDDSGLVWTVNSNAHILGVHADSTTPSLDGRVWLKSIRYPGLNQPVTPAEYGDVGHADRSEVFGIAGASLPLAVTDHAGGRDHTLILATRDQAAEDKLRLLLRLGDVLFVHVPADAPANLDGNRLLPGSMYALARGWTVRRAGGVSDVQFFSLPLTEVRKPAPDVVGTTLTVGQLIAEHDSIESVWAAYPSIRDMWDDIGDVNELVVI